MNFPIIPCLRSDSFPRAALTAALLLSACTGGEGGADSCEDCTGDGGALPDAAVPTLREQSTLAGDYAVQAQVLRSFGETLVYEAQ